MSTATVPLQPSQVSSVGINGLETQVNFADLTNCTTKPSSVTVNSQFGFDTPNNFDFCHPSIRYFISYLSTIQPEWATCVQDGQIIYDPPSALTQISALIAPRPPATTTQAASPSLVHSASSGAHFPQAPPLATLPTRPSKPKQAQIDPAGRVPPPESMQKTSSEVSDQFPTGLADAVDSSTKSKDATATGHVSKRPAGDPENTATDNAPSTSQLSAVVVVNRLNTPTKSNPDNYQANDSDEDPVGGPSDLGVPSPPHPSLIAGDQKITVADSSGKTLKVSSKTSNAQNRVPTISIAPATPDPLGEVGRIKAGAGQGIAAGSERNVAATSSADAGAGIGSARMSALGAVGGGAAIHGAGQGIDGNVNLVAPSLGTASKTCGDDANLWVRIGLGLLVSVFVVLRTN